MRPLIDRLVTIALFAVPVLFGAIALAMGQDSNWDLRNYHWYNPYAFLQGPPMEKRFALKVEEFHVRMEVLVIFL